MSKIIPVIRGAGVFLAGVGIAYDAYQLGGNIAEGDLSATGAGRSAINVSGGVLALYLGVGLTTGGLGLAVGAALFVGNVGADAITSSIEGAAQEKLSEEDRVRCTQFMRLQARERTLLAQRTAKRRAAQKALFALLPTM